MPEQLTVSPETLADPHYNHRSFELVFSKFSADYSHRLEEAGYEQDPDDGSFMGLPRGAGVKQMAARLHEASLVMGASPEWEADMAEQIDAKSAIVLSARYLAWQATMGGLTQKYIDKLDDLIKNERTYANHNGRQNLNKLFHEREDAVAVLLNQNHAVRDHFDSGLAKSLSADSPEKIDRLLSRVKCMGQNQREALVKGISLEIASKKFIANLLKDQNRHDLKAAYGNDDQDSQGGDLVIVNGREILFLDVKSSMPKRFTGGQASTPEDYERGYKTLEEGPGGERKIVLWAYQDYPVAPDKFMLNDRRLAANLELAVNSALY